jgi:hypothetical protein
MKLRLRSLLELVFTLGCGMGLANACRFGKPMGALGPRYLVEPFLVGTSILGAAAVWLETLSGSTRRPWGIGRWTLVLTGTVVFIDVALNLFMGCAIAWKRGQPIRYNPLLATTLGSCTTQFYGQVSWLLLVFWLASRFSKSFPTPEPDGREIAGRLLLATVVLWAIFYRVHMIATIV